MLVSVLKIKRFLKSLTPSLQTIPIKNIKLRFGQYDMIINHPYIVQVQNTNCSLNIVTSFIIWGTDSLKLLKT